ncbi:MAG: bifunctional demethylmenaquinone methyltransferase/2-methoxy-6-polyprenyl-1,4-benzoquinol methylase UbiE [Rhodopirellula sp. JB044]|uniref:bifunctional demethylmenaquinone methyltransferase/2-methoxy-6-polyprenyl-1,4-benzoquinol methylase UbiE n=1 Tax=Rhodopirellula sp. JB044 TaxID=3342844 RepID=UPI00370C5AC1
MSVPEPSRNDQPIRDELAATDDTPHHDGSAASIRSADRDAPSGRTAAPPLDKSGKRVREMFRQIAPRYDAMNHLLSLNIDKWWRRKAVDRLTIQGDAPILDMCCGTGDLAIEIANRAGSDVRVIGSDFCHAMLEIARDKEASRVIDTSGGAGRPTIPFFEADSMQLPFTDDRFQCVTVAFGLRNIVDTDQGIREMVRVCRPGGQVMVLEFSQPTLPVLKQLYGFYFRAILPKVGQWLARNDKSAYEYLPASVGQFPCGEALASRLRDAGLDSVEFHPLTLGVATIYIGTKPAKPSAAPEKADADRETDQPLKMVAQ